MTRSSAFGPALDARARVLVLGSLPGAASLRQGQFYAHPQNAFWRLIGPAIGKDLAAMSYPARLEALRTGRIGLWDVIASAVRRGSSDAAIRNAEPADLAGTIGVLPDLRAIAFNGGTAARAGRRQLKSLDGPDLVDLPSSSSAYAAMPFAEKLRQWSVLADYLA